MRRKTKRTLRWVATIVAAGSAYALALYLPGALALILGCILAGASLVMRPHRERWAMATVLVATTGVGIVGVLLNNRLGTTVDTAIGVFGGLLGCIALVSLLAPRRSRRRLRTRHRPPKDFGSDPSARWHAIALSLAAIGVCLGEGAGFAGAGLLLVALMWRHARVDWVAVRQRDCFRPLVALGLWLGFGAMAWLASGHGWLAPRELGRLGPLLVVPVFAWSAASLPRRGLQWAVGAFVAAMTVSSAVAIGQYLANPELDSWWLQPMSVFSAGMQSRVPGDAERMVGGGFYFHRLKLAHVLLLALGIVMVRQMFARLAPWRRTLEIAVAAICGVALLLTFTRGAVLGIGAGSAALFAVAGRRWRIAGAFAAVIVIAAALSIPSVRARMMTMGTRQAASDRAVIWGQAVQQIRAYPLGMGIGNYPAVIAPVYDEKAPEMPLPKTYGHNILLSAWAETGPGGAIAFVLFWVSLMVAGWKAAQLRGSPDHAMAGATLLFASVALWTVGMTHDVLYHKPVALAFYAVIGTALGWLCRSASGAALRAKP